MKNGAGNVKPIPKPRRNKCDLGPDFIAPDGGWGWAILIAAGCSNVSQNLTFIPNLMRRSTNSVCFCKMKSFSITNQSNQVYQSRANWLTHLILLSAVVFVAVHVSSIATIWTIFQRALGINRLDIGWNNNHNQSESLHNIVCRWVKCETKKKATTRFAHTHTLDAMKLLSMTKPFLLHDH